jgi:triacylglycerol lipase
MKRLIVSLAAACVLSTQAAEANMPSAREDKQETNEIVVEEDILDFGQSGEPSRSYRTAHSRYPLVFLHGFMGWDEIFKLDYFYQVRAYLQTSGYEVFTPAINPVNSIEVRARELSPILDHILQVTGAEKLNIIAHSMGGLDARYLINHGFGDRIASLTTIGTPHSGTPIPGLVFKVLGRGDNILYKAFEYLVAGFISKGQKRPSDLNIRANLWNLSPDFLNETFNPNNPDNPNIYYQSYAGVSSITGWGTGDRMDTILAPFQIAFGLSERNDGLVSEESAKWGRFRGVVSADHIDLIGQLFGTTSVRYQHLKFYKKIADELVDMGF